jgi:hypothetical protein
VEALVITWRELLIVVVLILAVYIAEVLLLTRKGKAGRPWRKEEESEPKLKQLEAIEGELAQLREQVLKLRSELDQMQTLQAKTPYSQAIQLAQQGLDANQLAANCGISRGEAELIVALYRANAT